MTYPTLFDQSGDTESAFLRFHMEHPEVFELFRQFSTTLLEAGRTRSGARMIGERIRWEYSVGDKSGLGPKINDHYWPRYARLLVSADARFDGFFELRKLREGAA